MVSAAAPSQAPNMAPSLEQLRPLHPPPEVGLWPPAPGWWLLALLLLGLLCYGFWRLRRHRCRNRYRSQALIELTALYHHYQQHGDQGRYLQQAGELLRRAALAAYPRERVAGLQGEAWTRFLAETGGLPAFTEGCGAVLAKGPYQPAPAVEVEALQPLLAAWLERHRTSGAREASC